MQPLLQYYRERTRHYISLYAKVDILNISLMSMKNEDTKITLRLRRLELSLIDMKFDLD
jgi:hypothetical protein